MPLKAVLLHIGEKDHANTKIIQQMRSIGSSSGLVDGTDYVPIPGIDLLVHILDATMNTGRPVFSAKVHGYGSGAILMYDTTRRDAFMKCPAWIDAFKEYAANEAVLLLLADRSNESPQRTRSVQEKEGKMFAENFGALYEEVDAREPGSAKHALYFIATCIYGKAEKGVLGTGPGQGIKPVASPQIRRHSTSCASPIHPPGNPFPGKRGGNSLSLGERIPEVTVLESQLSAAEKEAERMKAKETVLQHQEEQFRRENYELSQHLVAARREIETLNTAKAAMEHSLTQQLTQRDGELWRLNSEISSLQQTFHQLSNRCSALEGEKLGLSRALESQTQQSATVQWRLQQQFTLKEEALENEVQDHSETRAALRRAQRALDEAREESHVLRESQGAAEGDHHWRVSRDEVVINHGAMLGTGAWGYVAEGEFRGKRVAVKCLHTEIVASQTLQRVQREIHTMAGIRHPNIVLLVAAVLDNRGPPLIISELLDTNLRSAYQNHLLRDRDTKLEILHGVACALNYLHKLREPIIHRDLSSPNVLLRAARNNKWIPKLSDYGSANLARCSQTLGEGAIIYSAPETYPQSPLTPNSLPQTTKIDVYSFGVLTGELLTEQFPNPASLPSTLDSVGAKWPVLHTLMVSCTKRDPLLRLDMDTIIRSYIQPLLAPTAIAHST